MDRVKKPIRPSTESADRSDIWSRWLLQRRSGGQPEQRRLVDTAVAKIVERVLDGAQLGLGMSLVDAGTGEGVVAFTAIQRLGPTLNVILTDISPPLIQYVEQQAAARSVAGQCRFVEASSDKLTPIAEVSVDAVVTRASFAYVADKAAALKEFFRILKPGGRISLGEPVMQEAAFELAALTEFIKAGLPHPKLEYLKLHQRLRSAQSPHTTEQILQDPLTNYSERTLVQMTGEAGFKNVRLDLCISVVPATINTWEGFLHTSPHPLAPTNGEVMAERFSEADRMRYEQFVRPELERGELLSTEVIAYLTAIKP